MVYVKGGEYMMGTDSVGVGIGNEEKPCHLVKLSDYYIGKYEITQKQWYAVMGEEAPCGGRDEKMPVGKISFYDAHSFIVKLNNLSGVNFDLPSEAQWEYAANGGDMQHKYVYSGSNNIEDVGWYDNNANSVVQPIGKKRPNELGIYDMSGNVWEWCFDYYDSTYYKNYRDTINPQGAILAPYRTIRGGSVQVGHNYSRITKREGFDSRQKKMISVYELC